MERGFLRDKEQVLSSTTVSFLSMQVTCRVLMPVPQVVEH